MRKVIGGERGIRTLEGLLTLTPLAGVRLRPLGHLSGGRNHNDPESGWQRNTQTGVSGGQSLPRHASGLVRIRTIGTLAVLDAFENFFAVNSHSLRRIDADADLIAFHTENRDGHVLAYDDRFTNSSRQNEHIEGPPPSLFISQLVAFIAVRTPANADEQRCGTLPLADQYRNGGKSHNADDSDPYESRNAPLRQSQIFVQAFDTTFKRLFRNQHRDLDLRS